MNKINRKFQTSLNYFWQHRGHACLIADNMHKGKATSFIDAKKESAGATIKYPINQVLIFLTSFLLIMLLTGCAGGPRDLEYRHVDNGGANFGMQLDEMLTFDDYITQTSKAIAKYDGLDKSDNERMLVSPFEKMSDDFGSCNQSSRIGVLLIHGLTDSPFLMRDLSDSLINNQNCILVRAIALPGHATTPGNLLNVDYSQWIQSVEYGIQSFANSSVQNLFIGGFSTGGTLALNHVINETTPTKLDIKGLLLFSPAIRVKQGGGFLANWHKPVSRLSPKRA